MLKHRKANGFTLIELVIVIAVLGILAAIAIMRYLDFTEEAERNACLANRTTLSRELAYREAEGDDPQTYFDAQVTNALTTTEGSRYRCPSGGTYTLNAETLAVTCSIPTHSDGSIGNSTIGSGTGTGGGSTGGGGTGVDTSKLITSNWSDFLTKAAKNGSTLTKGSVFTDETGTYFVYDGSWISSESAAAKPTLEEAAAANLGVAKINLDSYLTSTNQGTDGNGKTIWTTLPTRGTVYSDGTDYYVYRNTAEDTDAYTGVNVTNGPLWLKISK